MSDEQTTEETPAEISELDQLKAENEKLTDAWKRTAADFENFKKRKEAESKEVLEFAKEMTVTKLIPSLQSLEAVLKFAPTDDKYKDWLTGLKATIIQLEKTMEEMGLKKIPTVGQQFDPNLHEAVETAGESTEITKEVHPGFTLNGRVIMPAKVVLGKKE